MYYVFLDTNIYENDNFSFNNGKFTKLKELAKTKRVQLLYNEVVYREVCSHIESNVKEAVSEYNNAIKNKGFAPFRRLEDIKERLELLDENELVKRQCKEWDMYLEECNAIKIQTEKLNIDTILNKYFLKLLPFENAKPNEFKDAIIIESICEFFSNIKQTASIEEMYVTSADKGFRKSFRNDKEIKTFDTLNKFINYVVLHTEHLALAVSKRINKGLIDFFVESRIIDEVYLTKFNVTCCDEDYSIDDVKYVGSKIEYIDVIDSDSVMISLDITARVCIDYMERDEKKSYYYEEEGTYLFDAFIEYKESHLVNFEAQLCVKIEEIDEDKIKDKLRICNGLLEEFDEDILRFTISFEDVQIPEGTIIQMGGGTYLERRRVKSVLDGYEIGEEYLGRNCIYCGEIITEENNAGNGYCSDCVS